MDQALQSYFDRISAILLDKQVLSLEQAAARLGENYQDPFVESAREVIRARTLSILRLFSQDVERKRSVILFLIETNILGSLSVSLRGADLSSIDLSETCLNGADLEEADLSAANMFGVEMVDIKLWRANLSWAKLNYAKLIDADLVRAKLASADLCGAELSGAQRSSAERTCLELTYKT